MRRAILAACLACVASCGYTQGFGEAPAGVRTVAIVTVANETYRQGLDRALSRALGRDLTRYTGLVPADRSRADAILRVELVAAEGRSISETTGGAVDEGSIRLRARVRLVAAGTGEVLREDEIDDIAEFRTGVGESLDSALTESVADLSRRILLGLTGPASRKPERDA